MGIQRASARTTSLITSGCHCCVAAIAGTTLVRAAVRARCAAGASTPLVRPWLLRTTGATVSLAVALFNHLDVPASFGLHVSITVIAAAAALAYLDVRGLRTRRCVAALLFTFSSFPLCGVLDPPWGSLAETAAFAGFFGCCKPPRMEPGSLLRSPCPHSLHFPGTPPHIADPILILGGSDALHVDDVRAMAHAARDAAIRSSATGPTPARGRQSGTRGRAHYDYGCSTRRQPRTASPTT